MSIKKAKLLILFMTIAILSTCSFAFASIDFSDIKGHWAEKEIKEWSDLGIIKGYNGEFRPNDNITRGEMAVILDRVFKYVNKSENSFSDLKEDFYTDAILKANYAGVILGAGSIMRAEESITREEAVTMIARVLNIAEGEKTSKFTDKNMMSSWSIGYINAMTVKGYIKGYGDTFRPLNNVTRAEVVKMLDNTISKIYSKEGIYKDVSVGNIVINVPNVTLKDTTVLSNLIISEGVADKEAYLENVDVKGEMIVRGGGEHSICVKDDSLINKIVISKKATDGVRIIIEDGSFVKDILASTTKKLILDGKIGTIKFDSKIDLIISGDITNINVGMNGINSKITILNGGKVENLIIDSGIIIENDGRISSMEVNADGVILDGNVPQELEIGENVIIEPKDSDGRKVKVSTGGGGSHIPTTTPTVTPSVTPSVTPTPTSTIIVNQAISEELEIKTDALFINHYNRPVGTILAPTDDEYYVRVASNVPQTETVIKIGEEVLGANQNVSVSMGNNNFIEMPAWQIDLTNNLYIAIPVLALESNQTGDVAIDLDNDNIVDMSVAINSNDESELSLTNATALYSVPAGYINQVGMVLDEKVIQTIDYGTGALGILLNNNGTDITDLRKVFTKKTYKDSEGEIIGVSYGVTETEGTEDATIGFYAAGWKNGPFTIDEIERRFIDYKVAVVGVGAIKVELEIDKRSKDSDVNVSGELASKTEDLFTNYYNKPVETELTPTDEEYYIKVASEVHEAPAEIMIGTEVFNSEDGISVSMGNNNFIELPAWRSDSSNNIYIAIPILALESSPEGVVVVDLENDGDVEIMITTSENTESELAMTSATALYSVPVGYTNDVEMISETKVTQTIDYGTGALGILLNNNGTDITDLRKVFTKKEYKDEEGGIISISYGVTETEGTASATIGFYAAGWKNGAFTEEQTINMDYKVAVVGAGAIEIELEINKTVKATE